MISFQEFCDDHSGFLRPVLDGYRQIRKKCLGEKVWKRLSRGRAEVMQWKYMDVMQIMVRSPPSPDLGSCSSLTHAYVILLIPWRFLRHRKYTLLPLHLNHTIFCSFVCFGHPLVGLLRDWPCAQFSAISCCPQSMTGNLNLCRSLHPAYLVNLTANLTTLHATSSYLSHYCYTALIYNSISPA